MIRIGSSAPITAFACAILAMLALSGGGAAAQPSTPHPLVTQAEYDRWQKELSNWGRWGKDDEMGTLNLITLAKHKQAAALAGLDNSVIPWLKKRDIALLGWETPDYVPRPPGDLSRIALHNFALTILGIHLIDRADFDAVAEAAAARNRWEFMLTVAPLPIPKGTGSPVNPIAMF